MKAHKKVKLGNHLRFQLDNHIGTQLLNQLYTQIDVELHNHIYDILVIESYEQLRRQCMNEIHSHL